MEALSQEAVLNVSDVLGATADGRMEVRLLKDGVEVFTPGKVSMTTVGYLGGIKPDETGLVPVVVDSDDGLLAAAATWLWGIPTSQDELAINVSQLRSGLIAELSRPGGKEHYCSFGPFVAADWDMIEFAISTPGQPLRNFVYLAALSNVIARPIALLASTEDVGTCGYGWSGCSALFLPTTLSPTQTASGYPMILSWADGARKSFVPLLQVSSDHSFAPHPRFSLPPPILPPHIVDASPWLEPSLLAPFPVPSEYPAVDPVLGTGFSVQ